MAGVSDTSAPDGQPFDHAQCHDCSYVQSISKDCVTHLQSLTKQTVESSQRLLQLVELREKVRDSAEFLSIDDMGDSTHSSPPPPAPSLSSGESNGLSQAVEKTSSGDDM